MPAQNSISETMDVSTKIDGLMRRLHASAQGDLHQILIADYSLADIYRHHLDRSYPVSRRPIVRATEVSWRVFRVFFGDALALWICATLWTLVGLPSLISLSLRLHQAAYARSGSSNAEIILLCTGVANEARIAEWLANKHSDYKVSSLLRDTSASCEWRSLIYLPGLLRNHLALCYRAVQTMQSIKGGDALSRDEFSLMVPGWMVLLSRRAADISWVYQWAGNFVEVDRITHLYFTMNYACESAFQHALPNAEAAYVEHGFPRRDIPPLACKQYVYSEGYAAYLKSFNEQLDVQVIGLDYFPKGKIEPTRTIVIATLQDWPQFKIESVKVIFNQALAAARSAGWRLVFRTRSYDTDAFTRTLNGPWDEVSLAKQESFTECLQRTRPRMVWTTWSTAILDSAAMGVSSVCFINSDLHNYFIADLSSFSSVITSHDDSLTVLLCVLQRDYRVTDKEAWKKPGSSYAKKCF